MQVMGDKQIRKPQFFLQILEHVDYLRLDRDVKRRNRLVANDEFGVHRQGSGDADSLPLAAGKLVNISGRVLARQADKIHQFRNPGLAFLFSPIQFMNVKRLADNIPDRHPRVQRRIRVLKNHRRVTTELFEAFPVIYFFPSEQDFPGGGLIQAEDRPPDRGFPAAGLADETERLAFFYVKGDVVDGFQVDGL